MAAEPQSARPRPRRGSLERPVSTRIYRASWVTVAVALAVGAFAVGTPGPLAPPDLPPSFDQAAAAQLATELASTDPDRTPGTQSAREAAQWVAERFQDFGLVPRAWTFEADLPELGSRTLVNVAAIARGGSPQTIVVMAHRDNLGVSPGADDNASGTAALLELARTTAVPSDANETASAHTIAFVSTDGGAWGGFGAAEIAEHPDVLTRLVGAGASVVAVVDLDAIAGVGPPRVEFAGDSPNSPAPGLLATADASILGQAGRRAERPGTLGQAFDLAFPFTLYEQGPLVANGVSAVTLTSGGSRPPDPDEDAISSLDEAKLGIIGRSAQALLGSLDGAAEVAQGTASYLYLGTRIVHGWTIQLALLALLVPFLATTVDLLARCRRLGVAFGPAARSLRSRLLVWAWAGGLFAIFSVTGILPHGSGRPLPLDIDLATDWPVTALTVLVALVVLGWIAARPRLAPTREPTPDETLAGHVVAMLLLAVVALVVAAANPYTLVFLLPSLHAWLWLPNVADRPLPARLALFSLGLLGPALLLGELAVRYHLGFDVIWYVLTLVSIGYVPVILVLCFLAWGAAAEQLGAVAIARYAPYPEVAARRLGPVRQGIRQLVLARRARSPGSS